jgi:hypothetical protein
MKNFIALALAALTLSSCSLGEKFGRLKAEEGTTIVQFAKQRSLAAIAPGPALPGGVMVYAERADGFRAAFQLADEMDTRQFRLPNGIYKFSAVGWPSLDLKGDTQCGYGGPPSSLSPASFTLAGRDTDIPVHLARNTCSQAHFAEGDFYAGSNFMPPTFVFCGAGTPVGAKASDGNCVDQESVRALTGFPASAKVEEGIYSATTGRLGYTAKMLSPTRLDFFSVLLDGRGTVKQNHILPVGANVANAQPVPSKRTAVYLTAGTESNLYVTELGRPGGTMLIQPPVTGGAIKQFEVSKSGEYLVFVGNYENASRTDIYSVALNGVYPQSAVRLNTGTTGTGVAQDPHDTSRYLFRLSPNHAAGAAQRVAFVGSFDSVSQTELYSSPITRGAAPEAIKLHAAAGVNLSVNMLEFLPDGESVVWRGNYIDTLHDQLRLSRASVANTSTLIDDLDAYATGNLSSVAVSPTTNRVAYSKFFSLGPPATTKVYQQIVTGTGPLPTKTTVYEGGTRVSSRFAALRYAPDGEKLIGVSDLVQPADGKLEFFGGPATQPDFKPIGPNAYTTPASMTNFEKTFQFGANNRFYFLNNANAGAGTIYSVDLASPARATTTIATTLDLSLTAIASTPGGLLYGAPIPSSTDYELMHFNGTASTAMDTSAAIKSVTDIHPANGELQLPDPYANGVFVEGVPPNAVSSADIWLKGNADDPNSPLTKLSHVFDDASGVGRFKIVLLPYHQQRGAGPVIDGPGISTECLNATATTNGSAVTASGVHIPMGGPATSGLFMTAIDVYPLASDCSGRPERRLVAEGFHALKQAGAAPDLKVSTSSSIVRIFLRD